MMRVRVLAASLWAGIAYSEECPASECLRNCGNTGVKWGLDSLCCIQGGGLWVELDKQGHIHCECLEGFEPNTFVCDKENKVSIPLDRVNDDLCDCGSDEPRTSACSGHAFSEFWCLPEKRTMPASWVADGICDCCDGSDELSLSECPDTCLERAERLLEKQSSIFSQVALGHNRMKSTVEPYETKSANARSKERRTLEKGIKNLGKDLERFRSRLEEEEKSEAFEKEKEVKRIATESDLFSRLGIEENESTLRHLWQQMNPGHDESTPDTLEELRLKVVQSAMRELHRLPQILNKTEDSISDAKKTIQQLKDFETDVAKKLRKEIAKNESNMKRKERDLEKLDKQDAFQPAEVPHGYFADHCMKKSMEEYKFEVCLVEKVKQSTTSLGTFSEFQLASEEQVKAAWKETSETLLWTEQPHSILFTPPIATVSFTNGLRCHQGTIRSATVLVHCGSEDEIISVQEPELCTYVLHVSSPAVCFEWVPRALGVPPQVLESVVEPWFFERWLTTIYKLFRF